MKSGRIDLHLHTRASDGSLSPRELVEEAVAQGVELLAVTDHDTVEGVAEAVAAGRELGVKVVPGVEVAVDSAARDIHLLGYFLRWEEEQLRGELARLREERETRNARILERLRELRVPVDPDRVRELGGSSSVGRPHIAQAMVEAGHVASQSEAFWRYLSRGKPAFVPRLRLRPEEGCRMIVAAGGIPVLAHAAKVGSVATVLEVLASGVQGLEVFHTDHAEADREWLLALAQERSLLVTGGTDSHGDRSERPTPVGSVEMPSWVGERFLARAPQWWRDRLAGAG